MFLTRCTTTWPQNPEKFYKAYWQILELLFFKSNPSFKNIFSEFFFSPHTALSSKLWIFSSVYTDGNQHLCCTKSFQEICMLPSKKKKKISKWKRFFFFQIKNPLSGPNRKQTYKCNKLDQVSPLLMRNIPVRVSRCTFAIHWLLPACDKLQCLGDFAISYSKVLSYIINCGHYFWSLDPYNFIPRI